MPQRKKLPVIRDGVVHWKCSKCREPKTDDGFPKNKRYSNGLHPWCRLCLGKATKKWRENNRERVRVSSRKWRESEHGRNVLQKWRENNREKVQAGYRRKAAARNLRSPEKVYARRQANLARSRGDLVPEPCEVCGTTEDIQGHHNDYSKPLEVRWLCRTHHNEHHKNLKIGEWNGQYVLADVSLY